MPSAQRSRSGGGSSGTLEPAAGSGGNISNLFSTRRAASWTPDLWGRIRRTVESNVASAQASAGDLAERPARRAGAARRRLSAVARRRRAEAAARRDGQGLLPNRCASPATSTPPASPRPPTWRRPRPSCAAPGAGDRGRRHPGAARARDRRADRQAAGRTVDRADAMSSPQCPTIPAGAAVGAARAAAGHRRRRAADGGGQRPDRRRRGRVLSRPSRCRPITAYGRCSIGKLLSATGRGSGRSVGSLAQTVFDAGARSAAVERGARRSSMQTVANYRQTVLTAFQQVEDQLAALRILAEQAAAQDCGGRLGARGRAHHQQPIPGRHRRLYQRRRRPDRPRSPTQRPRSTIRQSRLVASAALIQALGGGWDAAQLPSRERIEEDAPLNFSPLPPPPPAEVSAP